jgi:hypothetical protein
MKTLFSFFFSLFIIFTVLNATAAEREYRSSDDFLKSLSPAPLQHTIAEGDLNGDGLSDSAILVDSSSVAGEQEPKIYILLQTPNNSYYRAQESKVGHLSLTAVYLTIENGSLYVRLEGMNPSRAGDHQFKIYRGIWRMIGFTYNSMLMTDKPDGGPDSVSTNINLLTGDVIFKHHGLEKITGREKVIGGQCLLADYDFEFGFCVGEWKTKKGQTFIPGF